MSTENENTDWKELLVSAVISGVIQGVTLFAVLKLLGVV